jgi:hypothetical protein
MNAYFFKMTNKEKENILDKHKSVYDGYVTQYVKPNQEPLYVQDFANDKGGITLSNKGNVTSYKNMNINESDAMTGAKYLPDETFEEVEETYTWSSGYNPIDRIGDGDEDLKHGTMSDGDICPKCGGSDSDCEICSDKEFEYDYDDDETKLTDDFEPFDLNFDDLDKEENENINEEVNKTLNMFKRFERF